MTKKNKNKKQAFKRWEEYYNEDALDHWQHLMTVLDIEGYFGSKTQCKKVLLALTLPENWPSLTNRWQALRSVWINIRDFLDAAARNQPVPRHRNRHALAHYTETTGRFYSRKKIVSGSPLAALMATIE